MEAAVAASSGPTAWFSSQPFRTAAAKKQLFVPLGLLVFWLLYSAMRSFVALTTTPGFFAWTLTDVWLRFRVLGLRGAPATVSAAAVLAAANRTSAIADFGLLLDGCEVARFGPDRDLTVEVRVPGPVVASGYFFQTAADRPDLDPVRWELQTAPGGNRSAWRTIGASFTMSDYAAVPVFFPQLSYFTPTARGLQVDLGFTLFAPPLARSVTYTCAKPFVDLDIPIWANAVSTCSNCGARLCSHPLSSSSSPWFL